MPSTISKIAFCGLRRLNSYYSQRAISDPLWSPFSHLNHSSQWYHFSKVNIFVGANGSGKSTVLELLDIFRDPAKLCTVPRENQPADACAAFIVDFSNQVRVEGQSWPYAKMQWEPASGAKSVSADTQSTCIKGYQQAYTNVPDKFTFTANLNKLGMDPKTHARLLQNFAITQCTVACWVPGGILEPLQLAAVLNIERENLLGIFNGRQPHESNRYHRPGDLLPENTVHILADGRLAIFLDDDLLQPSNVQVSALPAGWRRLAELLYWLKEGVEQYTVCLIEEPEAHLHPRLQRVLAGRMYEIAKERHLQLFITTHAPAFQDARVWNTEGKDVVLFESTGDRLDSKLNVTRLLDSLGIRGSDINQSNGVVWVEGQSDRIYIKHWLKLWCEENNVLLPREHIDYSFMPYGGAVLSHFSTTETDEFIAMLRLNRNMMLVMDRDDDFSFSEEGKLLVLKPNSAKTRILREMFDAGLNPPWITASYTIETELAPIFLNRYFDIHGEKPVPKGGVRKVELALRYAQSSSQLTDCVRDPILIRERIRSLYEQICRWGY